MAPPKGTTNNPYGRPSKSKSLTTMLDKALSRARTVGDRRVSGKQIMSEMVDSALTTGRIKFPNDTEESLLSVKDWIDFVRWAYERIDGKPVQPTEISGPDGKDVIVKIIKGVTIDDL